MLRESFSIARTYRVEGHFLRHFHYLIQTMTDFRQVAISVTNRRYVPTFDTSSLGCRMNVNYLTI
ncbi:MAG: hypothetical protein C4297_08630 [Gemmataceae bacterium]